MKPPLVIGICGGSGSGKTYLSQKLIENSPTAKVCSFPLDSYYLPRDWQKEDSLGYLNFDLPEAFNTQKMLYDFLDLSSGFSIEQPIYKYNISPPSIDFTIIEPRPVIIVEGIFVFHYKEIFNRLDIKVLIDAPTDLKRQRRIERDIKERGYELDQILYRFDNHAEDSFKKYVLPYKKDADFLIETPLKFESAYNILLDQIREH
ncbi:uridine-cytidine kinase [uncultured Cytophaga sp.]|uniref:uridine kinase family protein n=1 Tax=uncultured Cytophaga sp. TaxID=160238 RepID=UPI0026094F9F|nr:uridine-cytidine kinase [uncultured Cytophaga sp.]